MSLKHFIWVSRWALVQWLLVLALLVVVIAPVFGRDHSQIIVCLGVGLLLGFLLNSRQGSKNWPWLWSVIDWAKVEREIAQSTYDES